MQRGHMLRPSGTLRYFRAAYARDWIRNVAEGTILVALLVGRARC